MADREYLKEFTWSLDWFKKLFSDKCFYEEPGKEILVTAYKVIPVCETILGTNSRIAVDILSRTLAEVAIDCAYLAFSSAEQMLNRVEENNYFRQLDSLKIKSYNLYWYEQAQRERIKGLESLQDSRIAIEEELTRFYDDAFSKEFKIKIKAPFVIADLQQIFSFLRKQKKKYLDSRKDIARPSNREEMIQTFYTPLLAYAECLDCKEVYFHRKEYIPHSIKEFHTFIEYTFTGMNAHVHSLSSLYNDYTTYDSIEDNQESLQQTIDLRKDQEFSLVFATAMLQIICCAFSYALNEQQGRRVLVGCASKP